MVTGQAFGEAVKLLRRAARLSQAKLAARSGVPKGTLGTWEHGGVDQVPEHPALPGLYRELGVSDLDDLMRRFDAMRSAAAGGYEPTEADERFKRLEDRLDRVEMMLKPRVVREHPAVRWPLTVVRDREGAAGRATAVGKTTGQWDDAAELVRTRELPYVILAEDADCMEPNLSAGDLAQFDPDALTRNGLPVVAYLVDDEMLVVKFYERAGDTVRLHGTDDVKTPVIEKHHSLVQVEGVVVNRIQAVNVRRY